MTRTFAYSALPMRVHFGAGSVAALPDLVADLGVSRVLVLCSPEQEDTGTLVADALGDRAAGVFAEARMHVPVDLARRAGAVARERWPGTWAPRAAWPSAAARPSGWARPSPSSWAAP